VPDFKLGRHPGQIPAGMRDLTYYAAGPLPKAPASVTVPSGITWDMDSSLSVRLFTNFYPQTPNTDVARNVLVEQGLRGRVVSVQDNVARAWVDGTLVMKHYFAKDVDDNVVRATVVGFIDFEPATQRIKSLRLVTDQATYGGARKDKGQGGYDLPVPFGVAVRSLP